MPTPGATEGPADHEHGHLEGGAHRADGVAAGGQAGHQAVPGAGPEPGADVEPRAHAHEHHAAEHGHGAEGQRVRLGQEGERHVHGGPDDEDVEDRAEAGALAQRHPEQEDGGAHGDVEHAQAEAGVVAEALVEDVPRAEAQVGVGHQGDADAHGHEAGEQSSQAAGEVGRPGAAVHP